MVEKNWEFEKVSGHVYIDPELISHVIRAEEDDEWFAVKFLDWNRSVGTDQAIRLQRFCEMNSMSGILVVKKIGENTLSFCNRHGIVTLTEDDLTQINNNGIISPSSR